MSFNGGQQNSPWQRMQEQSFFQPQNPLVAQYGALFTPAPAVSYPQPRNAAQSLNPVAFQPGGSGGRAVSSGQYQQSNAIGTVTKINNDCGLVNNEVFFYRSACKGTPPKLGDRVIFEASFSSTGQFKWNATRVQLMQSTPPQVHPALSTGVAGMKNVYNAVQPPHQHQQQQHHAQRPQHQQRPHSPVHHRNMRNERRDRDRNHRSRERDEDEHDRKRRREDTDRNRDRNSTTMSSSRSINAVSHRGGAERDKERDRDDAKHDQDHSAERRDRDRDRERAERSPYRVTGKGRRTRTIRRYQVQIPKSPLSYTNADVQELRRRFSTLYVPSDFFHAKIKWSEMFPPDKAFSLRRPCQFHIMHRIVEPPYEQKAEDIEPPDADYLYSAKVMLLSCPPIGELYQKCFENDESYNESNTVHPTRLISFLVGTRGRNEPLAIGGPWSPSLDGENPEKDPAVLIRTAIRTCKALTGIDLSNCTQWYRFVELHYHRTDYKKKEKDCVPRIETVVIYLPDVHSCMPTADRWQNLTQEYKTSVDNIITRRSQQFAKVSSVFPAEMNDNSPATLANDASAELDADVGDVAAVKSDEIGGNADADVEGDVDGDGDGDGDGKAKTNNGAAVKSVSSAGGAVNADAGPATGEEESSSQDIRSDGDTNENEKDVAPKPTHHNNLDLKHMNVQDLRNELIARKLPSSGARNMIMARLAKALNVEKAKEEEVEPAKPTENVDETSSLVADDAKENHNKPEENAMDEVTKSDDNDVNDDWPGVDVDMSDIVILDEYDASKNPEETPKELDETEKAHLIRRYTLPSTPHVIVHPNKFAKNGKFDCSVMSLSVLLDYRPEDTKERFFEVSLFAELFNEMLMRDFGFTIYKELYLFAESNITVAPLADEAKGDDAATKGDETKDVSSEKSKEGSEHKSIAETNISERSKRSNDDDHGDDSHSSKSATEKRRKSANHSKERDIVAADKKMVVVKPQLLLAFVYFDTSHCGYIFEKDLEELFSILGLSLSRGQIRRVLGKMATRQAVYYRKLTESEEATETLPTIGDNDELPDDELKRISLGNRRFECIFKEIHEQEGTSSECTTQQTTSSENEADLITHNGAVVNVGKLIDQNRRTERNFSELEKLYNDLRRQHTDLQREHKQSGGKIKDLQSEVKSLNRKISEADQDLYTLNRKYKDQQSTLSLIYNRVSPYFARDKDHKSESGRDKDADKEKEKPKDSKEASGKEKEKTTTVTKSDHKNKKEKKDDPTEIITEVEDDNEAKMETAATEE